MYHSYIWDFDGTLFDSYPIMLEAFLKTLKDAGFNPDAKEIYRILKASSSKQVAEKYHLDFAEFTATFKAYEGQDKRLPVSFLGTKEALEAVIAQGGKNYILTHRDVVSTKELLMDENLDHLITEIVGPENNFPRKPDPTSLNYLIEKYQMNKEQTVMVGDRTMDVLAGQGAGVHTIFYDIEGLLTELEATHVVHSMKEIEEIIKS
jgi:HAD superfamily hydrolase (TIGR01549 family)